MGILVCVCVCACLCVCPCLCVLQGGYSVHREHREGLKDGGCEEESACFILSVGSERPFTLFWCNQTPENETSATKNRIESIVVQN